MNRIIDDLAQQPGMLRSVTLAGPQVPGGNDAWPLWILHASAPHFGWRNALGAHDKAIGATADHVHPVRVLVADQPAMPDEKWVRPRLLDLHLVVGAQNLQYRQRTDENGNYIDKDRLLFGWNEDGKEVAVDRGKALRSVTEGPDESAGAAPFVHVVAEVLDDEGQDRFQKVVDDAIAVPPLRLIAGRVGLHVNLDMLGLKWLRKLGIVVGAGTGWSNWPKVWLVPDGIEFDAALPFPGRAAAAPLVGRVLLHALPVNQGFELRLKLLAAADPAEWAKAWGAIVPESGDSGEDMLGLKFAGRRGGALPEFSWRVLRAPNSGEPTGLDANAVEVPGPDVQVALVSPQILGAIDSVAGLRAQSLQVSEVALADGARGVQFAFEEGNLQGAVSLACRCDAKTLTMEVEPLELDFDLGRLVPELRGAYGIATPPPVPSARMAGLPFGDEYARPLIPAFVALDNGWLQLPVPNLGPIDTSNDHVLAGAPRAAPLPGVLDGFFRLRRVGISADVQSGFKPEATTVRDAESPWSLTVEQASGVQGKVRLRPGISGGGAQLEDAVITLHDPVLSARGLLWLSADRPDAQESLPRLGAGPGAFVDVVMLTPESLDAARPALGATLSNLVLCAERKTKDTDLKLSWDTMALSFRTDSTRWVDELLKPEEAREALVESAQCIDERYDAIPNRDDPRNLLMGVVENRVDTMRAQLAASDVEWRAALAPVAQLRKDPMLAGAITQTDKQLKAAHVSTETASNRVDDAQAALEAARKVLPDLALERQKPWPAVAWLRHPAIPLAAGMPMTRAAGGSQRPLESRDLHPYALLERSVTNPKEVLMPLALLAHSIHAPLLELRGVDGKAFELKPVPSWPRAGGANSREGVVPERGIGFACVGVPGVELRMLPGPKAGNGQPVFQAALRYDLPLLDEAFATAALPPAQGVPAPSLEQPATGSVPTALDWPQLAAFWREQERKQQNSRVVDSYLSGFVALDAPKTVEIKTLVRGLTWSTTLRIDHYGDSPLPPPLPYGALTLGKRAAVRGNGALAGYDGWLVKDNKLRLEETTATGDANSFQVLGFSPATFSQDGIDLDNAMSGAGPATLVVASILMTRPVTVGGSAAGKRLVSLVKPVDATINGVGFQFWFKDLLFDGDTAQLDTDPQASIAFDALDKDAVLARSGAEWRFAPVEMAAAKAAILLGRGEIPFFGFRLEPLRLIDLKLTANAVSSVELLCRLALDPRTDSSNLIRVILSNPGPSGLTASFTLADTAHPLRFELRAADNARGRRVRVTARCSTGATFALKGLSFGVEVAGVMVGLGRPAIVSAPGEDGAWQVVMRATPNPADTGQSRLRIKRACVSAGYLFDPNEPLRDLPVKFEWDPVIELFAQGEHADRATAPVIWPLGLDAPLVLLGMTASNTKRDDPPDEANGAISDELKAGFNVAADGARASVRAGLVVQLGVPNPNRIDGTVELTAGQCEGVLLQDKQAYNGGAGRLCGKGITVTGAHMHFSVGTNDEGKWVGQATVDASIDADNDVGWPALDVGSPASRVPLPLTTTRPLSGRVLVGHDTGSAAQHRVKWTLAGHRLPLTVAAAILRPHDTAVWVTPVVARHTLQRDNKTLSWTGVESIAVGRPAGLVPPVPAKLKEDASTFAARYKRDIVNGKKGDEEPGMLRAGAGAVATVLQGALGAPFRKLWAAHGGDTVMIAGGFVGMLRFAQDDIAAPLLRLPVLAGLGIRIAQDTFEEGIELAWNDGPAARAVALTRPTAASPANVSSDALATALLAGSLTRQWDTAAVVQMIGTVLVEQSFEVRPQENNPSLQGTPFFLAAAVSVNAVLNAAPAKYANKPDQTDIRALSLVACTLKRIESGRVFPDVILAAAVEMRDVAPVTLETPPRPPSNMLYVLGSRVRRQPSPYTRPVSNDLSMAPYLRAIAVTLDPDPTGFLLASYDGPDGATFLHGTIASMALDREMGDPAVPVAFADGSRGAPAMPAVHNLLRWLAAPNEGPGTPIRDEEGSGLAGLARRLTLPASASAPIDLSLEKPALDLVWLSQTQVPVYLPLQVAKLRGEPIGWLQPAPPRVRLPVDTEVVGAILESTPRSVPHKDTEAAAAAVALAGPQAQPFMPGQVAGASVGERAGIMTLRRVRILARLDGTATGDIRAYDAVNARFGAPAQASSSFARKLRTPRPKELPANCGDAARDRRIQASLARPLTQASALLGSADIVQGGSGSFGPGPDKGQGDQFQDWAIEVVASPESASVVSERWDGSVRLVCRIVVRLALQQPAEAMPVSPAAFLFTALGLRDGMSSARLKIGGHLLTYHWLVLAAGATQVKWTYGIQKAPCENAAGWNWCMASIALTLDPRAVWLPLSAQPPTVLPEIARALAELAVLPPVELQWTFLPCSSSAVPTKPAEQVKLDSGDPDQRRLVEGGSERAPLTLRMPLYPMLQARGSLPLTPSTLIFSDPTYDRDLANPPFSTVDKLKATGHLDPHDVDQRGDLRLVLSADRGRVNRRGVVTLMLDIAYERRMDELAQAVAEAKGAAPAGDLDQLNDSERHKDVARVTLKLLAASGKTREVKFGSHIDVKDKPVAGELWVKLATVYEMPLTRLVEANGEPADLQPGDVLQVSAALRGKPDNTDSLLTRRLWNTQAGDFTAVDIALTPVPTCTLALTLTDEAVVEPPPALYLALQRSQGKDGRWRLAMPLHAQSPLPRRVDLMDPARGFRTGLMRRHADFVWYLTCPATMLKEHALAVLKSDRNGQGYWPDSVAEFLTPEDFNIK